MSANRYNPVNRVCFSAGESFAQQIVSDPATAKGPPQDATAPIMGAFDRGVVPQAALRRRRAMSPRPPKALSNSQPAAGRGMGEMFARVPTFP